MSELVLIAVCTRRRPQMLAKCLQSLQSLQPLDSGASLQLLVVENDDQPLVCSLVENFSAGPYPLHYVQESQAGLSHARNRALVEGLVRQADWLAFIDDDEVAEPQWITELYRVAKTYDADAVRGPVHYHYPPEDRWAHLRDTGKKALPPEGCVIKEGATNNVLLSRRLFANDALGLTFDLRLNFTGGEDKLFFLQADAVGARMVYAPTALVHETVPLSRCGLRMLWRDKARLAANAILIERDILNVASGELVYKQQARKEALTALKQLFKSLKSLLRCGGDARYHLLKALLAMARVQGIFSGLKGRKLENYRHIQGG